MTRLAQKLVGARSLLALDYLTLVDAFTHDLTGMDDAPPELPLVVRGKTKKWSADYEMSKSDGTRTFVMVRTVEWMQGKNEERGEFRRDLLDAMKLASERAGRQFMLVTENEIRVQWRLYNARLVQRHVVPYRALNDELVAFEALQELPEESSIAALQERIGNRFDALVLAVRLHWWGRLKLDERVKFTRDSTFVRT